MASASSSQILSLEIDRLLEHYLSLLSQYDTLRGELSGLQVSIQQNLARANFDAQRGIRYGADLYDERMQAVRLCHITHPLSTRPSTSPPPPPTSTPSSPSFTVQREDVLAEELKEDEKLDIQENEQEKQKAKRDPLRMFGILTPQSLRMAQKEAVEMVEGIIPRLVSIDAEMREVEIQVRRARKFRGKAEVEGGK